MEILMVTADSITREQIEDLFNISIREGNLHFASMCKSALNGNSRDLGYIVEELNRRSHIDARLAIVESLTSDIIELQKEMSSYLKRIAELSESILDKLQKGEI